MAEVFISYSQKQRALVAPIAARLAELGVEAWFDSEISAGESFGAVIRANLKEAKAVLVCWSPEAAESKWVEAEADYARERGIYVPVFIAPCALLPPFNTIHSDDLSKWTGDAHDPPWLKLTARIAKLIGREGVAAAALALATDDEQARYNFAQRYPDEPTARKIWNAAEAKHRDRFKQRMIEAKSALDARISMERASLEADLGATASALEVWLADEQRAEAKGPVPDPLEVIERVEKGYQGSVRDEIAALQSELAQTRTKKGDLDALKAEIARLSTELAAAFTEVKARERDLDAAKAAAARLSKELADSKKRQPLDLAKRAENPEAQDYVKGRTRPERRDAQTDATAPIGQGTPLEVVAQEGSKSYERAAAEGDPTAMYNLGVLYHNGQDVAQDFVKAREWYEKSALKGEPKSMYNLGTLYLHGLGVFADVSKAREWYERAAAKGMTSAMYALGSLYDTGRGVEHDPAKALQWYEKAKQQK